MSVWIGFTPKSLEILVQKLEIEQNRTLGGVVKTLFRNSNRSIHKIMSGRLFLSLVGAACVAFVFSFGITDGHVGLDDWGYTSGCPFVRDGLCVNNVMRAFADTGYGAIWMPVTFISYMMDVTVFGDSWKAYHAINVVLHVINFLLSYQFLRRTLMMDGLDVGRLGNIAPFLGALVWALHPMRAEGVTFVASRKEELWTMFSLCGLMAYMNFLKNPSFGRYLAVVVSVLLSFMSKPTAMCFPFLALSIAYLMRKVDKRFWVSLIPLFVLSVGLGFLTVHSQGNPTNAIAVDVYDALFSWRVLNAIVSLGLYAWYTVCPLGIHIDYLAVFNGWPTDCWLGISAFVFTVVVVVAFLVNATGADRRFLLSALGLFAFSLGPTLGIFGYVNGDQAMADRYMYFPHLAIGMLLSYALLRLPVCRRHHGVVICGAGLTVLLAMMLTIPVVRSYENGYTACLRALKKDPNNWRALRVVGNEYCARLNRIDEGVKLLRKSMQIRNSKLTADSLAYVLAIRGGNGDFDEVRRLCASVMRNPGADDSGMMSDALGIVSMRETEYERAVYWFECGLRAQKRNHSSDQALLYLGQCYSNLGRKTEATRTLSKLTRSRLKKIAKQAIVSLWKIRNADGATSFKWEP